MDLRELLSVVWRRRLLVALVVVLCGGLGAVFAQSRDAVYESRVTLAIFPDVETQGFIAGDSLSALLGTYAETVESDAVIDDAEADLGRPLGATISASSEEGTGVLRVFARAASPELARDAATAVADAFLDSVVDDEFIRAQELNPAQTPTEPVQPRPPLIIGTAIVVGFGAAVLLALLIDRFRRRVDAPSDLAEISSLPLVGQIPRNRALRSGPRIAWEKPDWVDLQEAFRSLRTNLSFLAADNSLALQVSSASESQGKSTVVANLAVAFSQIGIRTAIIDADLRRPVQHEIFEVDNPAGAWTRAAGSVEDGAWRTRFRNLSLVPAGPPAVDPTETLHGRFPQLLQAARESFQVVLIDSAPLLAVSDARIIAPWSDGLILTMVAGRERPTTLRRAIHEVEIANAEIRGFVLNQVARPTEGGYYRRPGTGMPELEATAADAEDAPLPEPR